MTDFVLWRRLTETDFNAMHGEASPHGRGGGAMHIALGVRTGAFPIDKFLSARNRKTVTIHATGKSDRRRAAPLTFSSNPSRRGGEWLIRDQFSHRHPAWSLAAGFRDTYDKKDVPYVLIFRVGTTFHARFAMSSRLRALGGNVVPREMLAQSKGIGIASVGLLSIFDVPTQTLLQTLQEQAAKSKDEPFNPVDITDGRQRVLAAILRRQGQQSFRRKLLSAYRTQCAVTRCKTEWVLEAAHITPYRGIGTNAVSNGLLLRADIHTLFDLALISIEPSKTRIRVSSVLARSQYAEFDGTVPAFPVNAAVRPSSAALEEHFSQFHP